MSEELGVSILDYDEDGNLKMANQPRIGTEAIFFMHNFTDLMVIA